MVICSDSGPVSTAPSNVSKKAMASLVEAKVLSDASGSVTHDPLRNQLTRVVENLVCFQAGGKHPPRLHFALLTPRLFRDNPTSRLYGYKMNDYNDPVAILRDIRACEFPHRRTVAFSIVLKMTFSTNSPIRITVNRPANTFGIKS